MFDLLIFLFLYYTLQLSYFDRKNFVASLQKCTLHTLSLNVLWNMTARAPTLNVSTLWVHNGFKTFLLAYEEFHDSEIWRDLLSISDWNSIQRSHQFIEVHFASFLSGEFTTKAVINPPERKPGKTYLCAVVGKILGLNNWVTYSDFSQ